ncbi:hypothetical protein [Trinickia dinghuensis]|uniref:Uncharacterized protein n=1 Tax=Trinickia dinghuensis TaxID=2291023 RepID=A0A3D8JY66_9BURK|nr:hypothetical protein [Trinickia dinghuensis]RDU98068.1 hypothetical protein DWV00_16260 [Trinickia dinghuensis]
MTVPAVTAVQSSVAQGASGANAAVGEAQAAQRAMPAAPRQEADPAQASAFDAQMSGQAAQAAPTGTVHMHSAQATHSLDAVVTHMRKETAALDVRYQEAMSQMEHPAALIDPSDPMMTMVRLTDFTLSTSVTLQQYQFSMAMADASNGVTHSLLKNNAE